ncbi:MAG: hypothetical protein E6468_08870 [Varibaculum cambriense]|uniref:Uncharacterized protein n=1 Tax=Varibaculum cambriense TaxID=184870 RepID=A0AB34X0D7_9ACTO|nr:hypothetical protein [Varibaculum cambriense]KXB81353.1 hypothetical protein HMPREF1862_00542 [Varibaculum cambriense]MDU6681936.1 hypothetical protein [Varibaculum cambriense]
MALIADFNEEEQLLTDIVGLFLDNYQGTNHIGIQLDVAEGVTATCWYELNADSAVSLSHIKDFYQVSKLALRFWELSGRSFATLFLAVDPVSQKFVAKMEKDNEQFRVFLFDRGLARKKLQTLADRL